MTLLFNLRQGGEKKIVAFKRAPTITVRRRLEHALLFAQVELQRMLHDTGKRLAHLHGGLLRLGEQLRIKIQGGFHTLKIPKLRAPASFVPLPEKILVASKQRTGGGDEEPSSAINRPPAARQQHSRRHGQSRKGKRRQSCLGEKVSSPSSRLTLENFTSRSPASGRSDPAGTACRSGTEFRSPWQHRCLERAGRPANPHPNPASAGHRQDDFGVALE